ncbi:anion permease [Desulfovibrio mangrovi]|uniref:inorganic phosphate transporter n=1 Tax=Desulfovibrio mangrovi TaxID=2976983 RepID=UPI002246F24D|nr:inorganic phosphate transporter [Desulfovibrio mangrovi]UZP66295.1 anion permease [Desulfovibrio mangrovi]
MLPVFLSSGLFLGWSLGANDASNVFGTAVASRMVKFRTAAIICSVFVIIGAVAGGSGASHTLGKLGAVNALAGAFMVALSAALTVYLMTVARYPVSTSQAIVGAIVGWNLFTGSITDPASLSKIMMTWVACPALSAIFAVSMYIPIAYAIKRLSLHILTLDTMTRWGLILAGAFGSYALGANNIANVMGVFVPVAPFHDITFFDTITLSPEQQLFFLGGLAIATGVFTYSRQVMMTVGAGIVRLSPIAAFIVVTAHSLVLFVFSSQELSNFLHSVGLPRIPLVPVSSSQAIVGAVIGVGLLKGGGGIRWRTLGGIASSWVTTPIMASVVCFVSLFFLQNVFNQQTYRPVEYELTPMVWERIATLPGASEATHEALDDMWIERYPNAQEFKTALENRLGETSPLVPLIMEYAELDAFRITTKAVNKIDRNYLTDEEMDIVETLVGQAFTHRWRFVEVLEESSEAWRPKKGDDEFNKERKRKLKYLFDTLRAASE